MKTLRIAAALPVVMQPYFVLMALISAMPLIAKTFMAHPGPMSVVYFIVAFALWAQLMLGQIWLKNETFTRIMAEVQLIGCMFILLPVALQEAFFYWLPIPFLAMTLYGSVRLEAEGIAASKVFVHYVLLFIAVFNLPVILHSFYTLIGHKNENIDSPFDTEPVYE